MAGTNYPTTLSGVWLRIPSGLYRVLGKPETVFVYASGGSLNISVCRKGEKEGVVDDFWQNVPEQPVSRNGTSNYVYLPVHLRGFVCGSPEMELDTSTEVVTVL